MALRYFETPSYSSSALILGVFEDGHLHIWDVSQRKKLLSYKLFSDAGF